MPKVPLPQRNADGSYTTSPAGMAIDADGANGQTGGVPVYAPQGFTPGPLDFLANAGGPGNWFGVVTDTGEEDGTPVKQNASWTSAQGLSSGRHPSRARSSSAFRPARRTGAQARSDPSTRFFPHPGSDQRRHVSTPADVAEARLVESGLVLVRRVL